MNDFFYKYWLHVLRFALWFNVTMFLWNTVSFIVEGDILNFLLMVFTLGIVAAYHLWLIPNWKTEVEREKYRRILDA